MQQERILYLFSKIKVRRARSYRTKHGALLIIYLVVAAATEYYNDRKNYDPGAVIIKDVAQAVVIHYVSLRELVSGSNRLILSYAEGKIRLPLREIKYYLAVLYCQGCAEYFTRF